MRSHRALAGAWAILPLPALLTALTVLPAPQRVHSHWSSGGVDGYTSGPAFASVLLSTVAVVAVLAAGVSVLRRAVPPAWSRWATAVLAGLGWGAVVLYVLTAWRTAAAGPDGVGVGWTLLALLAGVVAAAVGYAVHGRVLPAREQVLARIPENARVQAVRGRAVRPLQPWTTALDSRTLQVIGWGSLLVMGAVAVWQLLAGSTVLAVVAAMVGLGGGVLALAWSSITLLVDEEGLQIRSRVLPVQVSRVSAEQVLGVQVQDLDPMQWGGVGLRPLPERTAYIVDRAGGVGIVVHRRDGRRLALQVTEGDAAARTGARTLLQAAGQRLGQQPQGRPAGSDF